MKFDNKTFLIILALIVLFYFMSTSSYSEKNKKDKKFKNKHGRKEKYTCPMCM